MLNCGASAANCCSQSQKRKTYTRCMWKPPGLPARQLVINAAVSRTAYSSETKRLVKCLLTRQALKTMLHYLSETNGEMHFFLHNYISLNPLPLDGRTDADDWIVQLAATPLTTVQDPRRSSVVSVASLEAAVNGVREVSPREIAERLMGLREHIAREMQEDLSAVASDNKLVIRRTLEKTYKELNFDKF